MNFRVNQVPQQLFWSLSIFFHFSPLLMLFRSLCCRCSPFFSIVHLRLCCFNPPKSILFSRCFPYLVTFLFPLHLLYLSSLTHSHVVNFSLLFFLFLFSTFSAKLLIVRASERVSGCVCGCVFWARSRIHPLAHSHTHVRSYVRLSFLIKCDLLLKFSCLFTVVTGTHRASERECSRTRCLNSSQHNTNTHTHTSKHPHSGSRVERDKIINYRAEVKRCVW